MWRVYALVGALTLAVALIGWQRADAVRDREAELRAAGDAARLKTIREGIDVQTEIDGLSDRDLCNELFGRLSQTDCPH